MARPRKRASRRWRGAATGYAVFAALLLFLVNLVLLDVVHGMPAVPAGWIAICVGAALDRRSVLWGGLVLGPLALLCLQWISAGYPVGIDDDPFGLQLFTIQAFIGAAFVTAVSGVILLFSAGAFGGHHSPNGN